ncbi:TnsA-like heteromeric transposase endonuclease subunit [Amycolatopsis sp. DG1A-15b]|uniref:TnsA-like heteromeric transposase endonuclease subunit n=1 Tax=Amycolatopsis sp. DG1A-15b TaxID=3052846 RepID=UPI00255C0E1D|nr:TnsA-like heteromeric transposase endonuclease subunit [Amycolatopsis sp. DG1A-15b]WIX85705.1 TnsA-like heteromeric transposase endonuclease subunit [Amycolatopsis sp. DG1A-15b]
MANGPAGALVSFRLPGDLRDVQTRPWSEVDAALLSAAASWRTFRWHRGQKHYSGTYWSSTTRSHVSYESRLELTRLLYADFDNSVCGIVAQPFLLQKEISGRPRKHVPDFLLLTSSGPVVVDVKPQRLLEKPEVAVVLGWTRREVECRGWRYEVWSEPPRGELETIRFLAGYRREWLFDYALLAELRAMNLDGISLSEACLQLTAWPAAVVRSALLHLLWCRHFLVDLAAPIGPCYVLRTSR